MMDIQLFISLAVGSLALFYLILRFKKQFTHIEKDPKCEDCPLPNEKFINNDKDNIISN